MAEIEARLHELGYVLPGPMLLPPGVTLPFPWVRRHGERVFFSGHAPLNPDGSLASPVGQVGAEVTREEAQTLARLVALAVLGSLKRELGDLDRVTAWLHVFGMVNSAKGFNQQPFVINGFSELIVELYGPERGAHARSAVGMAQLPMDIPVEIEGEVLVSASSS